MASSTDTIQNVSDTALWVAMYRAQETARPDALFKDPFAKRLAGNRGEAIYASLPGSDKIAQRFVERTFTIDELITQSIRERGVDVVINLASGLDTRPYRMALPADFTWFDVDLPGISQYKQEILKNEKPKCRLEYREADLSIAEERRAVLAEACTHGKTVLAITEGLLVYLEPEQVKSFARDLASFEEIKYWISDYMTSELLALMKKKGMLLLPQSVPFKFMMDPGPEMMTAFGWAPRDVRYNIDMMRRIKRLGLQFGMFWLFTKLLPKRMSKYRKMTGEALFERTK